MRTHKEISDKLVALHRRRPGVFGKWIPTLCWINKMDLDDVDNSKLQKALETCGTHMTEIKDGTHGHLCIEITKRKLPVLGQTKWFICCSTPDAPNQHVGNFDKKLFGKMLQASWDRHTSAAVPEEDELDTEQTLAPAPSPPQTTATATTTPSPTARTVSPSVESPPQIKGDSDLLQFFVDIISPEYIKKMDLFRAGIDSKTLRDKTMTFGQNMAADSLVKHYESFYDPPLQYTGNDITQLDPDPCLHGKYKMPMSVPAITEVATATYNLAERVPEVLHLTKYSGSKGHGKRLVAIQPSTDKNRLYQNGKQWLEDIINNAATTEESSLTTYDVIKMLIRILHSLDRMAFNHVAADVPQATHNKIKLDPQLQQAMTYKANLNLTQLRTIKSYLCYCNLDILQPESVMRTLQVQEFVRPIPIEFREGRGKRRRVSWYIPPTHLLCFNADKYLKANALDYSNLDKAHVMLVGDHGQGAFRMMVTLLLLTKPVRRRGNWRQRGASTVNPCIGTKLALEIDGQCGYAQCQKDTYQVLKDTIAKPINDSLLDIRSKKVVTIYIDRLDNDAVKLCFGKTHTQNTVLAEAAVEIFMVGDLAFYSLALGKEAMAPHWCWRCPMSKAEWSTSADAGRILPPDWTLDGLESHYQRLQSGELDKGKAEQVRGIKEPVLWCIAPKNILVPSLHNNELFVNEPLTKFMRWINHRVEELPLELIDARLAKIDLFIEQEAAIDRLAESEEPLAALKDEVGSLRPTKVRNEDRYTYRDAQHEADYADAVARYDEAKAAKAECQRNLTAINARIKSAKQEVKIIFRKKENGALSQPIRQSIDHHLQQAYNILRSAYHGGDFKGNHCRKLIRHASEVMDDIRDLLINIPPAERAADDDEIRKYCRAYKRLFQYFDALIHYCHQPFGTLSDADMLNVRKLVDLLDRLWRRLFETVPPKAHAWQHLVVDLERLRGLKHHSESKIEVSHQIGRKIDLLFRSVNDIEKKIECSLRHQHTQDNPVMTRTQQIVQDDRSRKRRADVLENDVNNDRNSYVLLLLNSAEIADEFPSLDALAVADRKREAALANVNHHVDNDNNNSAE